MLKAAREQKAHLKDEDPEKLENWKSHEVAQELTEQVYQDKFGKAPTNTGGEWAGDKPKVMEIDTTEGKQEDDEEAPALEEVDMDEYRRQEQLKKLTEEFGGKREEEEPVVKEEPAN